MSAAGDSADEDGSAENLDADAEDAAAVAAAGEDAAADAAAGEDAAAVEDAAAAEGEFVEKDCSFNASSFSRKRISLKTSAKLKISKSCRFLWMLS